MALSLKKLGTRALTALVFVLVLLTGLLWNYYSFTLLFFIIAIWGLYEFYKVCEALGAAPQKNLGYLLGGISYFAFVEGDLFLTGLSIVLASLQLTLLCFPFVIFAGAVFSKKTLPFSNAIYTMVGIIYTVLPFALLHHLVITHRPEAPYLFFDPSTLLGVILLIWCNDTFAYLGGSIFGKHKLIERVSPGKTWEGTAFGVLVTFGGSFVIAHFQPATAAQLWVVMGLLVPLLATLGDLVQSAMKRQAAIKDTGSIMPGHGGILDRFDSLIFVTPFVVVLTKLMA
ncbi:MAG: phosphatidate cytidylyltransferase [bacterium]|nr:phosphatidate cytidylyltransferase [bacterium]